MKREPIPVDTWFPITKTLTHRCCKCGLKHTFKFRTNLEMLVATKRRKAK